MCIKELTSQEAIKSGIFFSISIITITGGHFVICDNFVPSRHTLGLNGIYFKFQVHNRWYGQVMAFILLACKEMVTRLKELLVWMLLL